MSNDATSWARRVRGIAAGPKLILMLLADCHNAHTGDCFPFQETLAEDAGCNVRSVQRHIETLEKSGLIERHTETLGRGRGSRTHYTLHLTILQATNCQVQNNAPDKNDKCTRQSVVLDPTVVSSPYKDKPEYEPERTGREGARDEVSLAYEEFQKAAGRVPAWAVPSKLTKTRRSAIAGRIKEHGLDGWGQTLRRAAASRFLTGQTSTPFALSLDWFAKPGNFLKIIEGNYDNRTHSNSPTANAGSNANSDDAFSRLRDSLARGSYGRESERAPWGGGDGGDIIDIEPPAHQGGRG